MNHLFAIVIRAGALLALSSAVVLGGCSMSGSPVAPVEASAAITEDIIRTHTEILSADDMEGRAPATPGGEKAAAYIAEQYEKIGLEAAGDDGTWFQQTRLVGIDLTNRPDLTVSTGKQTQSFKFEDDFAPSSQRAEAVISMSGEIVFVGYGVHAPEFEWDDYKGQNLSGKVLMMLVNDPPATEAEPELFGGKALTYYGRWTYKLEEAARRGAAGALLVHTNVSAGYGWQVISGSSEGFSLEASSGATLPVPVASWISQRAAESILSMADLSLSQLQEEAQSREFMPISLGLTGSTRLEQKTRTIESPNVVGLLRGSDPELSKQFVVFTSHYDHVGIGKEVEGDSIYNGALDNAVGVAGVLALAKAMSGASERPKRSILFLMVTAEEQGLLGAKYYAENPLFPLARTAANINIDGMNNIGATQDIIVIGYGKSQLDGVVEDAARVLGMRAKPDLHPGQGFFFRSDQFAFAKKGVPAVYLDNGVEVIGKPEDYGQNKFEEYKDRHYHQPSDEITDDWVWDGAVQQTQLYLEIAWRVANAAKMPEWNPSAEFKAARDASLKAAGN